MRHWIKDVIHGDCIEVLPTLEANSVDLIYFDPPYGTGKSYTEYHDQYSREEYYELISNCLKACQHVLKKDSSIYVHVHMLKSHVVRWAMDEVFGERCFGNQIIIPTNISRGSDKKPRHWTKGHYVILRYVFGNYTFEPIYRQMTLEELHKRYNHVDPDGRRYKKEKMIHTQSAQASPSVMFEWQGVNPPRGWIHAKRTMDKYLEDGLVMWDGKWPTFKKYLDERIGHILSDVWDDDMHLTSPTERVGYPTQKPLRLLDRIITTSTKPGDTVLDPFCGSGTTLVSAARNERYAIGIDISEKAVQVVEDRINNLGML